MLKLEGKEPTEEFLCNPSTQPVPAGKWGESSSLPIKVQPVPGLHEISALGWGGGGMRWGCKCNAGGRVGDSMSQFHAQPGKAEQRSARATEVRINLEFSCLESLA